MEKAGSLGDNRHVIDRLPIDDALPELTAALRAAGRAVLQAPPGAGKTTRVPLALAEAGLISGRILMLEPRRLAARAAAERMAETLGEPVGRTVGYRIRGESRVTAATKIEVVTEGILTRMLQSDPELTGVGAVIFDEFHERSLNADLGLALAWEVRQALRPDLAILVMSATLDAEPVAALLDNAPVVTSEGRAFPVETRWLPRPIDRSMRFEGAVSGLVAVAAGKRKAASSCSCPARERFAASRVCSPPAFLPIALCGRFSARWSSPPSAQRSPPQRRAARWCSPRRSPKPP